MCSKVTYTPIVTLDISPKGAGHFFQVCIVVNIELWIIDKICKCFSYALPLVSSNAWMFFTEHIHIFDKIPFNEFININTIG